MEIINRYVYAVVKQLSKEGIEEVEEEIKLLIYDMMETYSEDISEEEKAKRVIEKLGDPDKLADKYRSKERYLIGPKYFNKYIFVLKVVLLSVFSGVTVAIFANVITNTESVLTTLINFISTVSGALLQGAAWVTVIFAIFEYKNVNLETESTWSIKDLPEVPHKNALISRGESIFSIIFAGIFLSTLYLVPELIGIYYKSNSIWVSIPVFNVSALNNYKVMIIFIFILITAQESLKIIWGKWTRKRAIINTAISIVSGTLTIMFFTNMSIWNSEISEHIYKYTGFEMVSMANIIVIIILIDIIVEIATGIYKGFKYGK